LAATASSVKARKLNWHYTHSTVQHAYAFHRRISNSTCYLSSQTWETRR